MIQVAAIAEVREPTDLVRREIDEPEVLGFWPFADTPGLHRCAGNGGRLPGGPAPPAFLQRCRPVSHARSMFRPPAPPNGTAYTIRSPFGDQTGLTASSETSRTGALPSTGILNKPGPCPSSPPVTIQAPSGDQSAVPCPSTPRRSMDAARVRELVPSADMMARRRFPSCLTTTATRLPSGDARGGSDSTPSAPLRTSNAWSFWTRQSPSPIPRDESDR